MIHRFSAQAGHLRIPVAPVVLALRSGAATPGSTNVACDNAATCMTKPHTCQCIHGFVVTVPLWFVRHALTRHNATGSSSAMVVADAW